MSEKHIRGGSREVFLFRNYVVKIPSFENWNCFLRGLLANMIEVTQGKADSPDYCPVLRWLPFGLGLVMKRAEPLPDDMWPVVVENGHKWDHGCVEFKPDSFGILDGRPVAIDFGGISPTESFVIDQYIARSGLGELR